MNHHISLACIFVIATAACSRQAPESRPAPTLTPASGSASPNGRPPASRCGEHFHAFDANGDGVVSRDEFLAYPHARGEPAAIFDHRDRDSNGSLSQDELCAGFRGAPGGHGPGMGPREGMGQGPGGRQRSAAPKGPRCEQHFDAFDGDQDGKISKEEFAARPHIHGDADELFAERDLDHDTVLTREEFCSGWRR